MRYNIIEGTVLDNNDPQQMGRLKIWCPAIDGEEYNIDLIPWATYMSPFAGQTNGFPAGSTATPTEGLHSYGFWSIPKIGANVIVAMLYGNVNLRVYLGSIFGVHGNRSLPVGRNRKDISPYPVSDTFDPVEPQTSNMNAQFDGKLASPEAQTRGAYERAVAEGKDNRTTGEEGYQKSLTGEALDPQTYCLTTPGRHALIFQDNPATGRLRLKTADGHQIIFDDANERIYISTSHGKTWVEMDKDGHIHMYGAASVSVSAGEDINFNAAGNFNVAAKNVNIAAAGHARISACDDLSLSGKVVNIESTSKFNILAAGELIASGSKISLNGGKAEAAKCADKPSITPNHEPWTRPATKGTRNKNWKK